jgi:hypothetical protein
VPRIGSSLLVARGPRNCELPMDGIDAVYVRLLSHDIDDNHYLRKQIYG